MRYFIFFLLHRLAWWASMRNYGRLHSVIYRYICPHPVGEAYSARGCFKEGNCGCDNAERFR